MKNRKKGQVSLEFLTTYGWAFLVALIAIGALAYFGVLNPSKYTPKRCNFGSEVQCNDYRIGLVGGASGAPNITMRLTNGMGKTVNVTAIDVTNTASNRLTCASPNSLLWYDGEVKDFSIACTVGTGGLIIGEKAKVQIKMTYYDIISGSSYIHKVNGEIYNEVIQV